MFDFAPDNSDKDAAKGEIYRQLVGAAEALCSGESDGIANMANVAALITEYLPDLNWAGFYRVAQDAPDMLILGPFIGRPACIRIPFGAGVCGAAAAQKQSQLVADVHAFPGHIACDAASQSELVVPVLRQGELLAIIDLDSPLLARFDEEDRVGIEMLSNRIASHI